MKIGEVCSREVYIYTPEEPLESAVAEMVKRHVGALVIVKAEPKRVRPVGIVTDRDVMRGQVLLKKGLANLTIRDVMTSDPLTIPQGTGIGEAIDLLRQRGVRRAPVVNGGGDLVGIVSLDDLLPIVAEELGALAQLVGTQARREGVARTRAPRAAGARSSGRAARARRR